MKEQMNSRDKLLRKARHSNHLDRNDFLFNYQFGFRAKRAIEPTAIYFTDYIRREANKEHLTGVIFIDLYKELFGIKIRVPPHMIISSVLRRSTRIYHRSSVVPYSL